MPIIKSAHGRLEVGWLKRPWCHAETHIMFGT